MAYGPAITQAAATNRTLSSSGDPAAFDAAGFDDLTEMIGHEGVLELVGIFENETRQRLQRLSAGGQDIATLVREMHTLKGAAGTVAAPRLTALGRTFEQAALDGIAPLPTDIKAIESGLAAYLAAIRTWSAHHPPPG
jgi:HPt (histidine-containing phosphotransfer) domain-containing protein